MMESYLESLLNYGQAQGFFAEEDRVFIRNALIDVLALEGYRQPEAVPVLELAQILSLLLKYAVEKGLVADTITQRDLFDTRLMGLLTPRPSTVIRRFWDNYAQSPARATDTFYAFSQATNYIRTDRIQKDLRWTTPTEYGDLEISINLSKPEKDPLDIALAKNAPATDYPICALCMENEGYSGSLTQAARQNHRLIPLTLGGEDWFFQYSPYVYYNEHCIALDRLHRPMKTDAGTFAKLFDFIDLFPHYFIGANADLPIVGGSILNHDHFQGGRYSFPMMHAPLKRHFSISGYSDIEVGVVNWPVTTLRLSGSDRWSLSALAVHILDRWSSFDCPEAGVLSHTGGTRHNAITPILRRDGGRYVLDLALRNNRATVERPFGLFHPRESLHHIKKENIGLIEVMGLAILPARLKAELAALRDCLLNARDPDGGPKTAVHAAWAREIAEKHPGINNTDIDTILQTEVGLVFKQVLEDAGVFKSGAQGDKSLADFVKTL